MAAFTERLARNLLALKLHHFSPITSSKASHCMNSLHILRNCYPVHHLPKQLLCVNCAQTSTRLRRCLSSASNISIVQQAMPTDVIQKVETEIQSGLGRLFAVVFIAGQQFKVTTNDLIQIQQHILADVGERICLQKVLLVGGDNFTLLGRPLLSPEKVRVEATVIEKTDSQKMIVFKMKKRTRNRKYHEKYHNLSVLRINCIEVAPNVS